MKTSLPNRAFSTRSKGLFPDRALQRAVAHQDECAVRKLLIDGHNPQAETIFGNSPISRASEYGYPRILSILLEHAQQNAELDPYLLKKSLILANCNQHLDCLRMLLRHNAKVPVVTCSVKTHMQPIIVAKAATFMLVNDYTEVFDFGMTELHVASGVHNAREIISKKPYLLNNKCTVGMSAAHIAAQQGNIETLQFLAEEAKIDLCLANIIDETALDTARRHNKDAAMYLESIGAPLYEAGSLTSNCQRPKPSS